MRADHALPPNVLHGLLRTMREDLPR